MTRNEALRLAGTMLVAAAAGWVAAAVWIFEHDSRPVGHPFDRYLDGTIAGR